MMGFIKKEFLIITRDINALWVLFIMPIFFILIMSFALKNSFSGAVDIKYKVAIFSHKSVEGLKSSVFEFKNIDQNVSIEDVLYQSGFDFAVVISKNLDKEGIGIYAKPTMSAQYVNILKTQISLNIQSQIIKKFSTQMMGSKKLSDFNITNYFIAENGANQKITSVDHSVPSWLIFSMFFILIPISNTFINERNYGTLDKLKSMDISILSMLAGKFIPYFLINQIQVFTIFLAGIFIMPLIGLDALSIKGSLGWIVIVSFFTSSAAISFGLLIANIANTSEEATTIGGVCNIIFAAIGGIMVPKFVMPKIMQDISEVSPMSWALDSFLNVIVGNVNVHEISLNVLKLSIFGLICLAGAYIVLKKRKLNR